MLRIDSPTSAALTCERCGRSLARLSLAPTPHAGIIIRTAARHIDSISDYVSITCPIQCEDPPRGEKEQARAGKWTIYPSGN